MIYKVSLRKSDEGYSVSVPGMPGCWSEGKTEAEALGNIKDAISEYVAAIETLDTNVESRLVEVG